MLILANSAPNLANSLAVPQFGSAILQTLHIRLSVGTLKVENRMTAQNIENNYILR